MFDGDTVEVRLGDGTVERVRLIGIDSPERGECFADEARRFLSGLVAGGTIGMTVDVTDRDRYERLLRYLWLPDGTMVNAEMVRTGHAIARRYPPDEAHADRFTRVQSDAEAAERGLWAPDACGVALDGVQVEITTIRYDAPGNDNENLNGEWAEIRNAGTGPLDLTGWVLKDESASHRYRFPSGFSLPGGATLSVFTGCGADTPTALYWCNQGSAIWNNGGDTGFLLDPNGNVVSTYRY